MPETYRTAIRIPLDLWKRVKALAARNRRTVTTEILIAIEEYLERQEKEVGPKAEE